MSKREIGAIVFLCLIAMAFSAAIYWRHIHYPACCDAVGYGRYAASITEHGLFHPPPSRMRTYGYPLFVSLLLTEADLSEPDYGLLAAQVPIVQTALFISAALLLFFVLAGINKRIAWCTLVGLLANPFILQYVPLRLTEGLNASLLVLLAAVVTALSYRADTFARRISLIGIGRVLAGIMLIIRPANISLVLAWTAFCTFYFAVGGLREWRAKLAAACAAVGGFALAVIPQVVINVTNFGKFTPLPRRRSRSLPAKDGSAPHPLRDPQH